MKKIKIIKCSKETYWYAPYVGKELDSNKMFHNGDANIHNSIVTVLRGVPSLDGLVVKDDYEFVIEAVPLSPLTKMYINHIDNQMKKIQRLLGVPENIIGHEK
jgi:DNA-binding protein Fis